jgi:hypothetical protein
VDEPYHRENYLEKGRAEVWLILQFTRSVCSHQEEVRPVLAPEIPLFCAILQPRRQGGTFRVVEPESGPHVVPKGG